MMLFNCHISMRTFDWLKKWKVTLVMYFSNTKKWMPSIITEGQATSHDMERHTILRVASRIEMEGLILIFLRGLFESFAGFAVSRRFTLAVSQFRET